jgi:hypothetical protein
MSGSLQINTPQALVQCQNTTILWTGGVGKSSLSLCSMGIRLKSSTILCRIYRLGRYIGFRPVRRFSFTAISAEISRSMPAVTFTTDERSRNWQCNVAAGVEISLSVRDSNGQMVYSSPVTVRKSSSPDSLNWLIKKKTRQTSLVCQATCLLIRKRPQHHC